MNIVNTSTRLPTIEGPYQVIVKLSTSAYHQGMADGVAWLQGRWVVDEDSVELGTPFENAERRVVAWADPIAPEPVTAVQSAQPVIEELTTGDVILTGFNPATKLALIKLIRELTGLGLGESKAAVETSTTKPVPIRTDIPMAEVVALRTKLVAAGAQVAA